MVSMRMRVVPGALVLAAVFASTLAAGPADADVGVFPVKVTGYPDNASVAARVLANIRTVLGATHMRELTTKPGCEESVRCRAEQVKEPIEEVAFVAVDKLSDAEARITLRVWDEEGQNVLKIESNIPHDEAAVAVEALLRWAFDPSRYGGILEVSGVPEGAELLVDGLRLEAPRAHLAVGQHRLEVVTPDRVIEPIDFSIAFGKTHRLEVPAPERAPLVEPPGASLLPSPWPTVIAAGVAVAGTATAVTCVLLRELLWRGQIELWQSGIDKANLSAGNDPTGRRFSEGYGTNEAQVVASRALVQTGLSATGRRGFEAQNDISLAGAVVGASVAVAAGTAAVVSLIFPGE